MSEINKIVSSNSLNFMSLDDRKISWLKNEKEKWYGSIKNLTVYPIILLVMLAVLQGSAKDFQTLKSSSVNTYPVESHKFDVQEQFNVMGVAFIRW